MDYFEVNFQFGEHCLVQHCESIEEVYELIDALFDEINMNLSLSELMEKLVDLKREVIPSFQIERLYVQHIYVKE